MIGRCAHRLALYGALLVLGLSPALGDSSGTVRAAGMKTYTSATFRYSIQYPGTWLATPNVPLNPSTPEPKLPKSVVAIATPGAVTAANLIGVIAIAVTPNRFSGAEIAKLELSYLANGGSTPFKPITRTTRIIHGVDFRQAATEAKFSSTQIADVSILSTRHGGFTYFLFTATLRGKKTSTLVAAQSQSILGSIRLH